MRQKVKIGFLFIFIFFLIENRIIAQSLTDFDGNVYKIVKFGKQTWMAENLRTTHYFDGTPLKDGAGIGEIKFNDTSQYYYYYNNNRNYSVEYGCLYSWYASVRGTIGSSKHPRQLQGVCPTGFHLPSMNEWEELKNALGNQASEKLRSGGISGFEAKLGGIGGGDTPFQQMGEAGSYLASNGDDDIYSYIDYIIISNNPELQQGYHSKICGYSVRCIKDILTSSNIDNSSLNHIEIYPNPSQNIVFISARNENDKPISYEIFEIEGKVINRGILKKNNEIDVSQLNTGFFFIRLITQQEILTRKLFHKKCS